MARHPLLGAFAPRRAARLLEVIAEVAADGRTAGQARTPGLADVLAGRSALWGYLDRAAVGWVDAAVAAQRMRGARAAVFQDAALIAIAIDAWRIDADPGDPVSPVDRPAPQAPRDTARHYRRVARALRLDPVVADLRYRARLRHMDASALEQVRAPSDRRPSAREGRPWGTGPPWPSCSSS
ncbi:hypothetical protein ACTG9Q_15805 [Actinokineospora sp. 24-640]